MWRNRHVTTILNFLAAQIAAMMNLIQFDFHKSRNCPDTVMKKAFPLSLPPFFKGQAGKFPSHFPLSSIPADLYCAVELV